MQNGQVAHHHADGRYGSDVGGYKAEVSRFSVIQHLKAPHIAGEGPRPHRDMHMVFVALHVGHRMFHAAKAIAAAVVRNTQLFSQTPVELGFQQLLVGIDFPSTGKEHQ